MASENTSNQNKGRKQSSSTKGTGAAKTSATTRRNSSSTKNSATTRKTAAKSATTTTSSAKAARKAPIRRTANRTATAKKSVIANKPATTRKPKPVSASKAQEKKALPKIIVETPVVSKPDIGRLSKKTQKKFERLNQEITAFNKKLNTLQNDLKGASNDITKIQDEALEKFKAGADQKKRTKLLKKLDQQILAEEAIKGKIRKLNGKIVKRKRKVEKALKKAK